MSSFYFIFFVETKWDVVAFHVFCFVLFLFSFLSFAWGRNDDIQKGCAQAVLARRWLSVRAGVAVRVYVPALLSSKYLHQTGNEIIQHPCARTPIHTQCGACARVYSLNVR